jgi:hypothetical protein
VGEVDVAQLDPVTVYSPAIVFAAILERRREMAPVTRTRLGAVIAS